MAVSLLSSSGKNRSDLVSAAQVHSAGNGRFVFTVGGIKSGLWIPLAYCLVDAALQKSLR